MSKKHIITSALLYANGPVHIGHIAGAYLPADIYVRFLKLNNEDVAFICGSDEHGAAITLQAKKLGLTPKEIIDKYHHLNKKTFAEFGIDFSIYHRTSEKIHHETAKEFFTSLEKNNSFEVKTTEQFYDDSINQFLADRYIEGECPKCKYNYAYGDQCEKCGSALSPNELINPKSTISGNNPILKKTKHWYLPMEKHEKWLEKWINEGMLNGSKKHDSKTWKTQVLGQCKSWISSGLKSRAITRDLDWGVKVPLENSEGKVLYVWFDAPIGYISATKEWAKLNNKNWKDYWKGSDTELVHFIGKDNIVFHCIIFPIILKLKKNYILPKNVPANEFLNLEGNKLSTSKNWAIWLHEYLIDFKDQQDSLRYALCATSPENKDTDFTWKDFQARNNNELVSIFGNFVNRVVVLTNKYWDGIVPEKIVMNEYDDRIISSLELFPKKIAQSIRKFRFREALIEMMNLARLGNKYLAECEPWKIIKSDEKRAKTILNISLQITASLSILSEPFIPFTSKKLKDILNLTNLKWDDAGKIIINSGHKINTGTHLFTKIEDDKVQKMIDKLNTQKNEN
tara:strand:- start:16686 stop:18392 length:1707 start_codon:yes stop_codon:yes gene_type:complete